MARSLASGLCVLFLLFAVSAAQAGERLDAIKSRGYLVCGVGANVPGFSTRDASGAWHGFDVDICRAIAAGIFGDAAKLRFKPIDTLVNFVNDPEIDVVLRGLTWTSGRELPGDLRFGPIILYDGQGFLVPKKLGIASPEALSGRPICTSLDAGFTDFLRGLRVYFDNRKLVLKTVVKDRRADAAAALFAGQCDAMSADASELAEAMLDKAPHPEDFVILPQQITKEPLAPLLRKGDEQFFDAVRWAIFALIDAEELGINSVNLERMRGGADPDVKAFFAAKEGPGLVPGWTSAILKAVGNYGEIFDRNFGAKSRAKLPRGLSRLWTQGGVLYAPPIR
ncbi:MAG TPA: transporter substrate-binding domain-containing protein [Micropepsaceae bacterium]|nr:transporter substrate-binding domain-containing protein [Micropepsaceae bacterium]